MKLTPFAVIYGGTLTAQAILSSTSNIAAGTVAQLNARIAELNANYAIYGYSATPNLPNIPAIPTPGSTAPNGIAYFQSAAPGVVGPNYGPSSSFLLIDAFTANGYSDPSGALDLLTADANVAALILAAQSLTANITTQPADASVAHIAANIAVVAAGTGLTYQWQRRVLGAGAWVTLTNTGVFTGSTTATLALSATTVLANNGDIYRCLINTTGGRQIMTREMVLTVT